MPRRRREDESDSDSSRSSSEDSSRSSSGERRKTDLKSKGRSSRSKQTQDSPRSGRNSSEKKNRRSLPSKMSSPNNARSSRSKDPGRDYRQADRHRERSKDQSRGKRDDQDRVEEKRSRETNKDQSKERERRMVEVSKRADSKEVKNRSGGLDMGSSHSKERNPSHERASKDSKKSPEDRKRSPASSTKGKSLSSSAPKKTKNHTSSSEESSDSDSESSSSENESPAKESRKAILPVETTKESKSSKPPKEKPKAAEDSSDSSSSHSDGAQRHKYKSPVHDSDLRKSGDPPEKSVVIANDEDDDGVEKRGDTPEKMQVQKMMEEGEVDDDDEDEEKEEGEISEDDDEAPAKPLIAISEDMSDISSEDEGQLQQKPVAEGKQGKPEPIKSPRTPAMSEEDSPHQRETQEGVGADESSPPRKVERSSRKVESSSPVKREVSSSRKVLMSRKGARDQEESDEGRVEMTERERPILESESEEEDSVKSRVESKGRMGSSVSVVKPKESSKEQEESKDRRRRMEDTGRDDRISRRERDRSEDRRYDEQERSGRRREWMDPGKGRGDAGNVREYNGRRKEDKSKQSSDTQKSNLGKTQAPLSDTPAPPKKPVGDITTKAGGAYIPPAKLRMMQEQITDKSSVAYQRMSWEALKKSITGLINKVNVSNIINIIKELFQENIVRGRGLLAHSVIQAQAASPTFTHVYAALVAIINTKFPQNGELILRRLILMFCRDYRRNDKAMCLSSTRFIAHLVNQQVAHEVLALEIFTLLLETPTDDSVEIAIGFLKECGQKLTKVSPSGINSIFEWLRIILHEGMLGLRVEYMVETMFAIRKDGFQDHQAVLSELDLVEEEEQFTHVLQVKDAVNGEEILNVFKEDNNFAESEEKYKALKKEILEEGSSDEESEEGSSGSESSESDEEAEERENAEKQKIIDQTETNLVALRRVIYLTIQSSLDHNECAHKLLKMDLKPGQEVELCNMILDCCAQLRTYEKFFGLLAERVCQINKKYIKPFQQIFVEQYETIHSLETNKLRKVAKFFAHMLHTDAISWGVLSVVKLTEEDMIPASRIFLKILFQELSEYLGLLKLNQRLKDSTLSPFFEGIMPRDNPKNTRFSINFFTTIGLGGLTDDLREHLKKVTKKIVQEEQNQAQAELAQKNQASPSSSSSSDDSDSSSDSDDESSSSDSSDSESDSVGRGKKKTALSVSKKKKPSEKSPIKKKVRKEDSWKKTSKERVHSGEAERKTGREDDHPSRDRVGKDKHGKDNKQPRSRGKERQTVNGRRTSSPEKGISIAARLLSMAQYGNIAHAAEESMPDSRKNGAKEVSRGEERFRDKSADKGGRRHRDISPEEQLEGRDRAKGRQRKDESEYRSGKRKEDNWKKNRDREEEEIDRRKQGDRDYHEKIRRERYDTRNQRDWGNIEKQNGSRPMGRREERDTREGYKNHEVGRGRIDKGRKDESNMRDNIEKGKPREQKGSRGKGSRGQDMEEKRHQRHDSSSSGSNSNSEDSDSSDGSSSRKPIKADGITNKYVSNGKAASSDRKRERTSPSPAKGKRPRKDCSSRSAS